ncbi:AAA family ATPase [Hymenobacter sp. H14-R3]|uniref:AAA family ATPase n=1 Tax=Hymenobacter sp. H14-R3 TaxID=3046308 RepID=UPI0024BABA53|nr:AAA family ATPase [Hymenobacter sp. H14-R3]MDJ0366818.1 AAA family ATPase [Hymenobacter sp. H14-R3]
MNEQLIVKNFGPFQTEEVNVTFKKVTVFIGPSGGGKSTLAKLMSVFRDVDFYASPDDPGYLFDYYGLGNYFNSTSELRLNRGKYGVKVKGRHITYDVITKRLINTQTKRATQVFIERTNEKVPLLSQTLRTAAKYTEIEKEALDEVISAVQSLTDELVQDTTREILKLIFSKIFLYTNPAYIPSERIFVSSLTNSWAGLMRDDIGLPLPLLTFANNYAQFRTVISDLKLPLFNANYFHIGGDDFIKIEGRKKLINLHETASGIQSVTPMLVLLEHLSRNTEQAQSFIIEEPELNLYPTAQQGLLNWLVEKCTKGENDLTINTHSPYILSHLNLLLYAHHVGTKDEEKRQKVAAIIPEQYWLNPDEFAVYYVNGPEGAGGVRSLLDPETKLISQNELDAVSGIQADEFDQLLDINRGF